MRFLVDECTGPRVAKWLEKQGYDVLSVFDVDQGINDEEVIQWAHRERRILISNDKDFGRKVYADGRGHAGVILLRLSDERSVCKIDVLSRLLQQHADAIAGAFVVVTEKQVRFTSQTSNT